MIEKLFGPRKLVSKLDEEDSYLEYFHHKLGSVPGTLSLETDAEPPPIVLIDYNESTVTCVQLDTALTCAYCLGKESVSWVDVQGLGNQETWQQLAQVFNLHPVVLEDVVNVPQRPKVEIYEDHILIIAQMLTPKEKAAGFYCEQVSFILGEHYLLTVQEEPEYDCFEPVRDRIRTNKGNVRKHKVDYLAYALLDAIIDGFFPVLENYGEKIAALEDEVVTKPNRQTLEKIYQAKRELLAMRRAIWPQRNAINILIRDGGELISNEVKIYMRSCYDHCVQILDIVETYREITSSLMDVYLSSISNKMNEIMKFLTVISSIFIPLTFIAGVYGMNFNTDKSPLNMPALNWYWGYPACLGVMSAIAFALVYTFWRRGWFENFYNIKND